MVSDRTNSFKPNNRGNGGSRMSTVFPRSAAIVAAAAFAAALPQVTFAAAPAPLTGTWEFVPDKSSGTPGPVRLKSGTVTLSDAGGGQMVLDAVDAQGKPVKATI